MNVIKRHKGLAIVGGLTLILLLVLMIIFSRMIFSTGKGEYGDRLNGITNVKSSVLTDAKKSIEDNENVEKANVRIQGKIIYTTIYVKEGTSKDKAKEIANKSLEKYDEKIAQDYDFEFLIHENREVKKDEEDKSYTIAGTKHPNSEKISWTK